MVASVNGAQSILRIGQIVPLRKPVEINGTAYQGYVRGHGCPRSVLLDFQAAYDRWMQADHEERRRREPLVRELVAAEWAAHAGRPLPPVPPVDGIEQPQPPATEEEAVQRLLRTVRSKPGYQDFLDAALLAVIPGLEGKSAEDGSPLVNVIPEHDALMILHHLSWDNPESAVAALQSVQDPNAPGGTTTGAGSSPRKRASRPSATSTATPSGD